MISESSGEDGQNGGSSFEENKIYASTREPTGFKYVKYQGLDIGMRMVILCQWKGAVLNIMKL